MEHKRIKSLHKFYEIQFNALKAVTGDDDDAVTTVLAINSQYLLVNNKQMIRQYISYRLLKIVDDWKNFIRRFDTNFNHNMQLRSYSSIAFV